MTEEYSLQNENGANLNRKWRKRGSVRKVGTSVLTRKYEKQNMMATED